MEKEALLDINSPVREEIYDFRNLIKMLCGKEKLFTPEEIKSSAKTKQQLQQWYRKIAIQLHH